MFVVADANSYGRTTDFPFNKIYCAPIVQKIESMYRPRHTSRQSFFLEKVESARCLAMGSHEGRMPSQALVNALASKPSVQGVRFSKDAPSASMFFAA
jgi:hypothetical protein